MIAGKYKVVLALACGLIAVCGCADNKPDLAKNSGAVGAGPRVHYYYDALGRLIQAASSDGNGVQYGYDAVGNITAIRRLAADALSVVDFAPRAGPVGSTVTVYGSGFDATAAENVVTFNGTPAVVNAATETTLIVNVPDGATSGKITISNSRGSATSTTDYVVSGTSSTPTISGFTPIVGTLGTLVTLTGSNFDTHAEDDKVTMAGQFAVVVRDAGSPTATQLKVNVPSATASGKIEITTPFGSAISASEFFAVPVTVNPADVEFTGRLTTNDPALTMTTTTNGKKAALLFDAQAGQRLHLVTTGGTFTSAFPVDVYGTSGTKIETLSLTNNGVADFSAPVSSDGTYVAIVRPSSSDKGTLQIRLVADVTGPIAMDGSTALNLTAGQNARFSFTGEAGTGYGLAITGLSFTPSPKPCWKRSSSPGISTS